MGTHCTQLWIASNSNLPYPGYELYEGTSHLILKMTAGNASPAWIESWGLSTKGTPGNTEDNTVLSGRFCSYSGGSGFWFSNSLIRLDPDDSPQAFLPNARGLPGTPGTVGEVFEHFRIYQSGGMYVREYRDKSLKVSPNAEVGIVLDVPTLGGTMPRAWIKFRSKRQTGA